jgi:hypothetical protein
MSTTTVVRAITLTIAVALTVVAINLEAYVVPPVLAVETATVAASAAFEEEAEAAAYPIELPVNPQLCPC